MSMSHANDGAFGPLEKPVPACLLHLASPMLA